jgi:homoserine acetyltransferase
MNKADLELLVCVDRKAVLHIEKALTVHDVSRQDAIAALRMRKEQFPVSTISFVV